GTLTSGRPLHRWLARRPHPAAAVPTFTDHRPGQTGVQLYPRRTCRLGSLRSQHALGRRLVTVGQLISARAAVNAVTAAWRSSGWCAAETCVRIRALPTGTTG